MTEITYNIAKSFSPFPGGRTRRDGPFNGTTFRESILKPMLEVYDQVTIELDGLAGFPSSFSEEVFGGCIRKNYVNINDIGSKLKIVTHESDLSFYIPIAYKYANDAWKKRKNG